MNPYFPIICSALLDRYNRSSAALTYKVSTRTIFPSYYSGTPYEPENWEKFREAVEIGVSENLWSGNFEKKRGIFTCLTYTQTQATLIAERMDLHLWTNYADAMRDVLHRYCHSPSHRVRQWADEELRVPKMPRLSRLFPFSPNQPPDLAADKLDAFLRAAEYADTLDHDITLRSFSCRFFDDSKTFERQYKRALCELLEPTMPCAVEEAQKDILRLHHIFPSPPQILLRGDGLLRFSNGDTIHLRPEFGHIAFTKEYADGLTSVEGGSLLTIENLTTFHEYPAQPQQIIVYTGGYPSHIITDFIRLWLQTADTRSFFHFGDIDAFGFHILLTLQKRTDAHVVPLHMDLQTYEANLDRAIPLREGNQRKFGELLEEEGISEDLKELFRRQMTDNLMLEQENIRLA